MSQRHVEQIIGRLVTDDDWRARYVSSPSATLSALAHADGLELTDTERRALQRLPLLPLDALARELDARLQRLAVRR